VRLHGAIATAILLLAGAPAWTDDVMLMGQFVQGGLVQGRVSPGAKVTVDGHPLRVGPDGDFLVGFGRDAQSVTLGVTYSDGRSETRTLAVEKRSWQIQRVDGLPPPTVTPNEEELQRIRAEAALAIEARKIDSAEPLFRSGFIWPAVGPISGVYGSQRILNGEPRAPHYGVDIAVPPGTPVVATADGTVTLAYEDMLLSGKTLILDHGYGLSSVYYHLSEIAVASGARVRQGEMIGRVGATGRATGPHLHWGMNLFDARLDPALLVPPMPQAQNGSGAAVR
jgi:murein DD-endopeptidase MepM/ murein hydrolase activator NlpD